MATINIKGYIVLLDKDDVIKYGKLNWYIKKSGNGIYFARSERYGLRSENKKKRFYLHRVIMNVKENETIDHINGNTLDNRKSNLRLCTKHENSMNGPARNGRKYKGVYKNNFGIIFAQIKAFNRTIYLGTFKTEKDAAIAYNKKAKELFKKFARLNNV